MNCQTAQNSLLTIEKPDQPPNEVAAHLAECLGCHEWHQRLLQLENQVRLLPVPPSSGKSRVLAKILATPSRVVEPRKQAPGEPSWVRHERQLKRLSLASALTAALVLIAIGLWLWRWSVEPPNGARPGPVEDQLLASLMKRNLSLASAHTPRQRIETLAELADDLHSETLVLVQVADAGDLAELAGLYQRVVEEGIVKQAQALPVAERAAVLGGIAGRLERIGTEADVLAGQVSGDSARPLRDIAAAAREGDRRLRVLLRGEKS